MALVALAEMGASPARLQEFFDMWEREYALAAPFVDTIISRHEWSGHLGDTSAFGALRLCFLDWIADAGPVSVITEVLQAVPFAPATQAFHALIRLAYGIEAEHAGEIASGLASLVSSHLPIDVAVDENRTAESVDAGLDHVARAMSGVVIHGNSITSRLRVVASDVRFAKAVLAPPADVYLLDDLARATIEAYWRNPNFTILHTVTATRAARIVFAELPDTLVGQLLPSLWVALCAAYTTVGCPANANAHTVDATVGWIDVCRMAVASNDDHVIKMVYTCLCEDRRNPSPLYLASAARLL
ncbi:questin oxidase family protein [Paraburkholderia dilworthii]|uniref:questin oxidase family protein n=1 Tax=Paraburkholderia dilworthii TaxID=948106 RepID=UPI00041B2C5F|nr:questin oxidase family protein [Paraburkholderia dilworthii]